MGQFHLFPIGQKHARINNNILARVGFQQVFDGCFHGKEAVPACHVFLICADGQHEPIGGIAEHLTIAALIHVTIIIGPIYGHDTAHGFHCWGLCGDGLHVGFMRLDQCTCGLPLLFQGTHHGNQVIVADAFQFTNAMRT